MQGYNWKEFCYGMGFFFGLPIVMTILIGLPYWVHYFAEAAKWLTTSISSPLSQAMRSCCSL